MESHQKSDITKKIINFEKEIGFLTKLRDNARVDRQVLLQSTKNTSKGLIKISISNEALRTDDLLDLYHRYIKYLKGIIENENFILE